MGCEKQGKKKPGSFLFKKRRSQAVSSFLNTNDCFFAPCGTQILDLFLKVLDPKKISGQSDKLE